MPFFLLLLLLFGSLKADELTVDPKIIWETNCQPCRPAPLCLPPPDPCLEDRVIVDLRDPIYEKWCLNH